VTYTFTGTGNWSEASNWDMNGVPPDNLASGDIFINGDCTLDTDYTLGADATLTVTVNVTLTILGTGNRTLTNDGTISIATGAILNNDETLTNNGSISIATGATLNNNDNLVNEATGVLTNDGILNAVVNNTELTNNGTLTNNNVLVIANGELINNGSLTNSADGSINNNRTLTNNSVATLSNEGTISINNQNNNANILLNNFGTLINNGTITRDNGDVKNNSGATLFGTGTIDMIGANNNTAAFINAGTIRPGNSIGTLRINGDFENNGAIIAEVNGPSSSDLISVTGTATLGGTLTVVNVGVIDNGNSFLIIQGNIASVNNSFFGDTPTLPGSFTDWTIDVMSPDYVLTYTGEQLLPIELLSFSGKQQEEGIQLTWSTATELDNDYMAVERSADGRVFDEIGRIPGRGTTFEPQTYTFLDPAPLPDINYYRLRQVDFDGATEYHPVITVLNQMPARMQLNAFPNPVMEELRISYNTSASGNLRQAQLRLFDANGRLLRQRTVEGSGGVLVLSVENLPSGLYLLELSQNGQSEQQRFVKE